MLPYYVIIISLLKTKIMFKKPFSFNGRIRRTEYGLSIIIFAVARVIVQYLAVAITYPDVDSAVVLSLFLSVPLIWFLWAQGAKRCHDVGMSGWWQIVPFFPLYMLFAKGHEGSNEYGEDPKKPSYESSDF